MAILKIGNKEYTIKFDYLAIREFAKSQGVKKPSEVPSVFDKMDLDDPSFEDIDVIAELVRSGIKAMKVPPFKEVLKCITESPEAIGAVFAEFNGANNTEDEMDANKEGKAEEEKN